MEVVVAMAIVRAIVRVSVEATVVMVIVQATVRKHVASVVAAVIVLEVIAEYAEVNLILALPIYNFTIVYGWANLSMGDYMAEYSKFIGKKIRYVTMCVAEFCNLKCSYCYEYHKRLKTMSESVVAEIVDKEFASLTDDDGVCLDFFGGEPFLGFETIKFVDGYIQEKYSDKNYVLFATTNGTLIHGAIQEWLTERPYFVCGLSLDGNKYSHNINRDNSFDKIDLDFFARNYPEQTIKMTISQETLPHLYENIVFCHDKGFRVAANLAFGIDWNNIENQNILEQQLKLLIDYYIAHPEISAASLLNFDITPIMDKVGECHVKKWCGTGDTMHTYDTDGNLYACQFFMPISLGDKALTADQMPKIPVNIPLSNFDDKCKNCRMINICPMCYGSNYASTGSFFSVDDGMCKMTKIIMKARSYFRALQLEKGQLPLLTGQDKMKLIDAIMVLQNEEL